MTLSQGRDCVWDCVVAYVHHAIEVKKSNIEFLDRSWTRRKILRHPHPLIALSKSPVLAAKH
jgi:hypothetical protein